MATQNPYPAGDPNHTLWNMMHLTAGPGSDQALKESSQEFGIDFGNHNAGFQIARFLLPTLYPSLLKQQLFANSLQPLQQNTLGSALTSLQNPDQMAGGYRSKVNAQVGSTLQNVLQRLKSTGAGLGAQQGAAINAQNQANTAGNQYQAHLDSYDGQKDRLNGILSLISASKPDLNPLMQLNSITQGTPRGSSGLQQIAGSLGSIGNMIGGMGGGNPLSGILGGKTNPFTNPNNWQQFLGGMG